MGDARPGRLSYSASRLDDKRKRVVIMGRSVDYRTTQRNDSYAIRCDLLTLRDGEVIEIQTESGSTYWIIRTTFALQSVHQTRTIKGFMVTTNSRSVAKDLPPSPHKMEVDRQIEVGGVFNIYYENARTVTSTVVSIYKPLP